MHYASEIGLPVMFTVVLLASYSPYYDDCVACAANARDCRAFGPSQSASLVLYLLYHVRCVVSGDHCQFLLNVCFKLLVVVVAVEVSHFGFEKHGQTIPDLARRDGPSAVRALVGCSGVYLSSMDSSHWLCAAIGNRTSVCAVTVFKLASPLKFQAFRCIACRLLIAHQRFP